MDRTLLEAIAPVAGASDLVLQAFDFDCPTRIVFGAGKLAALGELTAGLGVGRALVVTDGGIIAVGHAPRGVNSLEAAGVDTCLFADVHENPTTEDVDRGLAVAREYQPDVIIGLGGGSSMDCAKGINFLLTMAVACRTIGALARPRSRCCP